jgi:phosphatidylglycerophosphate synthase
MLFKPIEFLSHKTRQAEFWGDLFLTYSLLLSVAISVVLVNKKRNMFWLILALSSLLLSFGFYMTWDGAPVINFPMPFAWFVRIAPFFKMFRYAMIFVVPLLMALAFPRSVHNHGAHLCRRAQSPDTSQPAVCSGHI